jgi:endonuclease YncB( thermonuclease family)
MRWSIPSYTSRRVLLNRFVGRAAALVAGGQFLNPAGRSAQAQSAFGPATPAASTGEAGLSPPEIRQVAEVVDGNGLRLEGGENLRLLAIEAPESGPAKGDPVSAGLVSAAREILTAVIAGRPVSLRYDAIRRDRYGRRMAHAFAEDGAWLQAELVKAGLARVHGDSRDRYGLRELMALEADSRARKLGIWRIPAFAVHSATDAALERLTGSFQIVAGKVAASALAKGNAYLNFGADRDTDLTLVLNKPGLALAAAARLDIAGLAGRNIRCRGWLESFNGPRIQVTYPEQIEVLQD